MEVVVIERAKRKTFELDVASFINIDNIIIHNICYSDSNEYTCMIVYERK